MRKHNYDMLATMQLRTTPPPSRESRYQGLRERMADGSEGRRMRQIKLAYRANASMRAQGRVPGAEGRAVIEANRKARAAAKLNAVNGINMGTPSVNVKLPPPPRG